ncbi:TetR family transcriptional regulator, partial [Roseateles chitinivorans]
DYASSSSLLYMARTMASWWFAVLYTTELMPITTVAGEGPAVRLKALVTLVNDAVRYRKS